MGLGCGHRAPHRERSGAEQPMSADSKQVLHNAVDMQEALGAWLVNRKPRICRSRWRVGWWEASARLFAWRAVSWLTNGMRS